MKHLYFSKSLHQACDSLARATKRNKPSRRVYLNQILFQGLKKGVKIKEEKKTISFKKFSFMRIVSHKGRLTEED